VDRRPPDDGSPGRIIATMVGIVGILLLGSLFWSALGALVSALGEAGSAIPVSRPSVVLTVEPAAGTPTAVQAVAAPTREPEAQSTPVPTRAVAAPTRAPEPTATPVPTAEPTQPPKPTAAPTPQGRAPWVLLPRPEPGSKIGPGAITLEARGRGDAPIADIRLELDGAPLSAAIEQRSEDTWRGAATARVQPGSHTARAVVVDATGRTGAFRWTFEVEP
jgi:hypothetical protein